VPATRKPLRARTRAHLLEVARCPLVEECLEGPPANHPCATIVLDQWRGGDEEEPRGSWRLAHQLPEPWDGHLETAPILFVSSNPSISGGPWAGPPRKLKENPQASFLDFSAEEHPSIRKLGQGPRWYWQDDEIVDRYEAAFDLYIEEGIRGRLPDGTTTKAVRFWVEVRARARGLIPDREVRPGIDYALTEAVRCKSQSEHGVGAALQTCSRRYLKRTLEVSGARVIVVLGRRATNAMLDVVGISNAEPMQEGVRIGRKERAVVFLPHPNAHRSRTFAKNVEEEQLARLRALLADV
jgi:hypothetical protein